VVNSVGKCVGSATYHEQPFSVVHSIHCGARKYLATSSYIWISNHSLCSFFHFDFFLLRYWMKAKSYWECESKEPNLTSPTLKIKGREREKKKKKKDNKNNFEMINSQGKIGLYWKNVRISTNWIVCLLEMRKI